MAVFVPGVVLFDPTAYLARNPDVAAAAGKLTSQALADFALTHFLTWGAAEGRDPLGEVPANAAGAGKAGLTTTLTQGSLAGDVGGAGSATGGLFDATFYLATYTDVQAAAQKAADALTASGQTVPSNFFAAFALEHFVQFGASEKRAPSGSFDPTAYLAAAPDVNLAVEEGLTTAVQHYLQFGESEARSAPGMPLVLEASTRAGVAALSNTGNRPVTLDLVNTGNLAAITAADLQNIHNLTTLQFDGTGATSLSLTDAQLQSGTHRLTIFLEDASLPTIDMSGVSSNIALNVLAGAGVSSADFANHVIGNPNISVDGVPLSPPAPAASTPVTVFTTGTDNFTGSALTYTATLGGASPTLTAGDSLHGSGNTLNITDTAASSHDTLPGSLSLTGVTTLKLTTAGNAGVSTSSVFDLSGLTSLTSFTLDASGANNDYIKAGSGIDLTISSASPTVGIASGAHSLGLTDNSLTELDVAGSAGAVTLHDPTGGTTLTFGVDATTVTGGFTDANNKITSFTISGTSNASSLDAISDSALTGLTVTGSVSLGSSGSHLVLPSSLTTIDLSGDSLASFIDVGSSAATVTLANGNNTVTDTHGGNTITVGNGTNTIDTTGDSSTDTITVGTGTNTIKAGNLAQTIKVGPDGNFGTDSTTPNLTIENARASTTIEFTAASGGGNVATIVDRSGSTFVSLAQIVSTLEQVVTGHPRELAWGVFNGDTYAVYSAVGITGSADTSIVKIGSIHTLTTFGSLTELIS